MRVFELARDLGSKARKQEQELRLAGMEIAAGREAAENKEASQARKRELADRRDSKNHAQVAIL